MPSITNQIFVNEKKEVLPIETANKGAGSTKGAKGRYQFANKDPKIELSGFRDYIEQEQLDRATVNDFICSRQSIKQKLQEMHPLR